MSLSNLAVYFARQELLTQLERLRLASPNKAVDTFEVFQQPKWFKKLPFDSPKERIQFIEALIEMGKDTELPVRLISPFPLYKLFKVLAVRKEYLPFEDSTLKAEISHIYKFGREFGQTPYPLLHLLPAKWLMYFSKHLYNNTILSRKGMKASLLALSFEQIMALIELGKIVEDTRDTNYFEIGAILLPEFSTPESVEIVVTQFLETILPLFLDKFGLTEMADKTILRDWFKMWVQYRYPNFYKQTAYQEMTQLSHRPFEQILQYIPNFILETPAQYSMALILHLGNGQNIRQLPPYDTMSKKMAHLYINAGKEAIGRCRFTWSYVSALCSDEALRSIIYNYCHTGIAGWTLKKKDRLDLLKPLILSLNNWYKTVSIEAERAIRNILAYYSHCRQEGIAFSLKGRTAASLLRLAQQWQADNQRKRYASYNTSAWEGADYEPWEQVVGETQYQIVQLLNSTELIQEGANMRHCVGGYIRTCANQKKSIWSLRKQAARQKWISIVTIEVSDTHRLIQAKAKCNARPKKNYLKMIYRWAEREELEWCIG